MKLPVSILFILVYAAAAAQMSGDSLPPVVKPELTLPAIENKQPQKTTLSLTQPAANSKYSFSNIFKGAPAGNFTSSLLGGGTGIGGSLHPQAVSFVQNYKDGHEKYLNRMKGWGAGYFSVFDGILMQYGVPRQLKYLAVIESGLHTGAVSWAGAAGPWQFMPGTARDYGLQVNGFYDERYDLYKSTHAAARYLKDLYASLKDWMLVVAAYNGGPGRVYSAIAKSGSRNFWNLQYHLPAESRNHVKKFIATQYIMEGNTQLLSGPAMGAPMFNPLEQPTVSVDTSQGMATEKISGRYNSLIIAKYILMDIGSFNAFNPGFTQALSGGASEYGLKLPADKMALFRANKLQIMNESLQLFLTTQASIPAEAMFPPPVKPATVKKKGGR